MFLSSITSVGWCANMMLDRKEQVPFTINDLWAAVDGGDMVGLLSKPDNSGAIELWASRREERAEVKRALGDAAGVLRNRELRKTGIGKMRFA